MTEIPYRAAKPGVELTAVIESLTHEGRGSFHHGPREVVVRGAWPGDEVDVRVVRRRRGLAEAVVQEVISEGTSRRDAPCVHIGECGGCIWQQWSRDDQREKKRELVRMAFAEGLPGVDVDIAEVMAAGDEFGYRNKMELSFDQWKESPVKLGLHHAGRYNVVFDMERCHIAQPVVSEIAEIVRQWANRHELSVYRSRPDEGLLRYLVLRCASTGEVMVNLVVSDGEVPALDELVDRLTGEVPRITSLILGINGRKGSTAITETSRVLAGKPTIAEKLGELEFDVSPASFLQTNAKGTEVLYDLIAEVAALDGSQRVLDLYCGMGLIGLWLANSAREVVGLEQVPEAIADAERLRDRMGMEHVSFLCGNAEHILPDVVARGESFDVVIVDPPRAGLHPKALKALVDLRAPAIVYVSCNPRALARDMGELLDAGYRPGTIQPVDMFPHTAHVETVVRLDLE